MVGLKVGVDDPRVVAMVALGTPIHVYDYSYLSETRKPVLLLQGEHDEFGSAGEVEATLGGLGDHVTILSIPGAGHLFEGHLDELRGQIRDYFSHGDGARALDGSPGATGRTV
jgi:alpha/beta superfamily hydrolase